MGWLDASSVIDTSGSIRPVRGGKATGYIANAGVVASGHGAAAIIVARPACEGDPLVDWYRDGAYRRTGEQVTPFGWSADGRYIVEGHLTCSSMDAELHGWKGKVDVVDFASGKTLATLPDVRGEMALSPSGTRLAAQSDSDVEIADLGGGAVVVAKGVRRLDDRSYPRPPRRREARNRGASRRATGDHARAERGTHSIAGRRYRARHRRSWKGDRGSGGRGNSLLALGGADLTYHAHPDPAADEHQSTRLAAAYWSPDGRMLALPSADGQSIALISVDPDRPAAPQPTPRIRLPAAEPPSSRPAAPPQRRRRQRLADVERLRADPDDPDLR